MRAFLSSIAALALLASGAASAAAPARSPEAKLADILKGRVAGKPVNCLMLQDIRSTQIIDRTAIVYETSGGRYYVNRPKMGADSLSWDDVLVTDTHSSQLCSVDTVRLYDSSMQMQTGFVGLGEFVPYQKPAAAKLD